MDLEEQLKNVEVIDEKGKKDDKIKISSIVTIENLETKEKGEYKIVGITETDILAEPKKISNESPV
jgi:transcription elongation GreA/GreB family factor